MLSHIKIGLWENIKRFKRTTRNEPLYREMNEGEISHLHEKERNRTQNEGCKKFMCSKGFSLSQPLPNDLHIYVGEQ
jgi:hypothetical protein